MKQSHFILSASIAAALASASAVAQPVMAQSQALAGINTAEASRVTQTINTRVLSTLGKSHLQFVTHKTPVAEVAASTRLSHLQLMLKRSALRQAALTQLMADQHNPASAKFHQWLTPQQFGDSFGVSDADIVATKAWLVSQGFTVNGVYPNKMQIDFSGTAGQVNQAFHTQENRYKLANGSIHRANASDISIPAALSSVVGGVAGLADFHPQSLHLAPKVMNWNAAHKSFNLMTSNAKKGVGKGQAISFSNGARGLVPNDLMTMYGIRQIRANGVTGKGITIAVVDEGDMKEASWTNFITQFNLAQYGGTFKQYQPVGPATCNDPGFPINRRTKLPDEDGETLLDAEWSTAIAPSAAVVVANCASGTNDNFFGGVFAAATNLINADSEDRPNIISASYGFGEQFTDAPSKTAIDLMWAQADAEGISVFVSTGDSGSNPSFNGYVIQGYYGNTAVDANSFATSANVTAVGGTDTADVLDGTTSTYFSPKASVVGGSALSYVPEIPWNQSCGNGVAALAMGYNGAPAFCLADLNGQVANGPGLQSEAGSGGPSSVVSKPVWQRQVYNAAKDQSRDLPDVSLFAGSYGGLTYVITCTATYPCNPGFTGSISVSGGTSLSSPMFAGIQALIDQGLADRGLAPNQGNAAPTLYALAADEYGSATEPHKGMLKSCNSDNGATGSENCVFHNVTRGTISSNCYDFQPLFTTENCYFYGSQDLGSDGNGGEITKRIGLTTTDANPTSYSNANKAFPAQPGWSFAAGLGSVDARNLLIAWRAFVHAPARVVSAPK